jgi:hypothetical protein
MTQPPPHGWHQQPPPGWQQPPPGWHPHPPRKGKGAIIAVVIVAVVLLLGGLGTGAYFFVNARKDHGYPLRNDAMPEQCGKVSSETLAKARTTNPDGRRSSRPQSNTTNCHWDQTAGRDNPGYRVLRVQIWEGAGKFEDMVGMVTSGSRARSVGDIGGLGDEAKGFVTERPGEAPAEYSLAAREGDFCVLVEYTGADPGLFSLTRPDVDELARISRTVMNDVLGEL